MNAESRRLQWIYSWSFGLEAKGSALGGASYCQSLIDTCHTQRCQVPCGIFDDPKLVADVKEAVATIKNLGWQAGFFCEDSCF